MQTCDENERICSNSSRDTKYLCFNNACANTPESLGECFEWNAGGISTNRAIQRYLGPLEKCLLITPRLNLLKLLHHSVSKLTDVVGLSRMPMHRLPMEKSYSDTTSLTKKIKLR